MIGRSSTKPIAATAGAWPSGTTLAAHRFLAFALACPATLDMSTQRALLELISPDERARYDRIPAEPKQAEFVVSRALLRRAVGALLGRSSRDIRFTIAAHGKPMLCGCALGGLALRFNLSHADGYHLLAVTLYGEIGADIEAVGVYKERIARRFFSSEDLRELERCAPAERAAAFYQLWTIKEACVKALGTGLEFPLSRVCVTGAASGAWLGLEWQALDLFPAVKAAVAIALADQQAAPRDTQVYTVDLAWLLVGTEQLVRF